MSKPVIQVENLSKAYQLGQIGTGTISRDIERFWITKILGKEDPFLSIGETNDRATKGTSNIVWSLKDLNFTINQGEAVGIIGKNGAGKSTLLKLLSRVTAPTTGQIKVKGRIASLLEVGTGFHPELSGRENIYLNGAILGMRKAEITRKFDEIVDFAGVERYIDTPVKRYSSGMYVRLAFAVAAHLESEILIVDEVLSVGDAEFQKKCLGKMGDLSKGEGRTVLFVSHNMAAVKSLCTKGIILKNGEIAFEGTSNQSVEKYLSLSSTNKNLHIIFNENSKESVINLFEVRISPIKGIIINVESGINVSIKFHNNQVGSTLTASIVVFTNDDIRMFEAPCYFAPNKDSKKGIYYIEASIPPYILNSGIYNIMFVIGESQKYVLYKKVDLMQFQVEDTSFNKGENLNRPSGLLRPNVKWQINYDEKNF